MKLLWKLMPSWPWPPRGCRTPREPTQTGSGHKGGRHTTSCYVLMLIDTSQRSCRLNGILRHFLFNLSFFNILAFEILTLFSYLTFSDGIVSESTVLLLLLFIAGFCPVVLILMCNAFSQNVSELIGLWEGNRTMQRNALKSWDRDEPV